jgi:hypothetical protein
MTKNRAIFAVAAVALLVLAGCGSSGYPYGNYPSGSYNRDIQGTVSYVDRNNGYVDLTNASGYAPMLSSSGSGNTVRIYYDRNTTVQYNGRNYRVEDLDPGDQVDVRVSQSGNRLIADSMTVTYNASASSNPGTYPNSGSYSSTVTGTVRNVATSRRTIEIDPGYGQTVIVNYDPNTTVSYNGRTYRPADLQRGDQVSINVYDNMAQSISVNRSISDNGTYDNNSNYATVRGTVRYVDTSAHTIQLDQTNWISGFNTNPNGTTTTVQYDPNTTNVDISGRLYPVTGLERGDVVDVQMSNAGSSLPFAQRITLVRNVRQ